MLDRVVLSQISMYYAETRADNSIFTNHRVTCLGVMGSPFASEQACWVSLRNCILWRNSKSKRGNNSNKMLDGVVFSCQQIEVNTFYKCIEFQVNNFDSYWEILIILKKYP